MLPELTTTGVLRPYTSGGAASPIVLDSIWAALTRPNSAWRLCAHHFLIGGLELLHFVGCSYSDSNKIGPNWPDAPDEYILFTHGHYNFHAGLASVGHEAI